MRTNCRIGLISTALILTGCIQYASGYKRKGIPSAAAQAAPAADSGSEGAPADETPPDTTAEDAAASMEPATAAETTSLVNVCASCHHPAGIAKTVVLNKAAIPRLNDAYLGKNKVIHSAFHASFVGEGRKHTIRVMSASK